jgi:hypothetical protein
LHEHGTFENTVSSKVNSRARSNRGSSLSNNVRTSKTENKNEEDSKSPRNMITANKEVAITIATVLETKKKILQVPIIIKNKKVSSLQNIG